MEYLNKEDLIAISKVAQSDYISEKRGLKEWQGVMERVRMKYYPSFFDKAGKLLVDISKGHFYSNGNKRLALVTVLFFIGYNEFKVRSYSKKKYKECLKSLFPVFNAFKDYSDFSGKEFAFYNLSIIIAASKDSDLSYDDLRGQVKKFLQFALYSKTFL